jgi:transposase-like protein
MGHVEAESKTNVEAMHQRYECKNCKKHFSTSVHIMVSAILAVMFATLDFT